MLDLLFAIVRRATHRKALDAADKGHLHHRLVNLGHGHRRSVLILWTWTALLCAFVLYPVLSGETRHTSRSGCWPSPSCCTPCCIRACVAPAGPTAVSPRGRPDTPVVLSFGGHRAPVDSVRQNELPSRELRDQSSAG
jgi:hypothetical protein